MELTQIFKCLADPQRLRILNLMREGPLCVCHIQEILSASQVKTSKQLLYMTKLGLLEASRVGTWKAYHIHEAATAKLFPIIDCIRTSTDAPPCLTDDLELRSQVITRIQNECCTPDDIVKTISCTRASGSSAAPILPLPTPQ